MKEQILRVAAETDPGKLASSITHYVAEGTDVYVHAVSEGPVFQAVKALNIATDFAGKVNTALAFTVDFYIDSSPTTGRTFTVTEFHVLASKAVAA